MNEYQIKRKKEVEERAAELNALGGLQWEVVPVKHDENSFTIKLLKTHLHIYANYTEWHKEWFFYVDYKLPFVDGYDVSKVKEGLPKLNKIHKLSEKVVRRAVEHEIEIYRQILAKSNERVRAVSDFEGEMKLLKAHIMKNEYADGFSGYVVKNGIEFRFEVTNNGYISKKIQVHYKVDNSIGDFLALSNNKYIEK